MGNDQKSVSRVAMARAGRKRRRVKDLSRFLTLNLEPEMAKDMDEMQKVTGLSKTELVKRALKFYFLLESRKHMGEKIIMEDQERNQRELVFL